MKQFNGYFGCSWCLERETLRDWTLRYLLQGSPAEDRTHSRVVRDLKAAFRQCQPVHGIKGPSVLLPLKGLDLVWCLSPDYMHCVLEGVAKQLTELWLSTTGAPFYIGGAKNALNSRILAIRPPISFFRLPRPISERAHWKAKEWQYWLLFYSLPCLKGALTTQRSYFFLLSKTMQLNILPTRYFHHFALLCQGMFLLLGTKVTELDAREAERLLFRFVDRIVQLSGHSAATFNVHQLLQPFEECGYVGPVMGILNLSF
ncbi:unnamed protein product [Ixodes persulcatus]